MDFGNADITVELHASDDHVEMVMEASDPDALRGKNRFALISIPRHLFRVEHGGSSRFDDTPLLGNWDIFLNVLNVKTEDGATGVELQRVCYGAQEPDFDAAMSGLYIQVLRPLCWAGLLEKQDGA